MLRENLSINVTPGGVPVIIHISQYDIGLRTFVFAPYTSHGTFTPDAAAAATLEGTKPDGNIIVHNCEYNATTGEITYTVQEQLAAVTGKVWSKLTIRDTSGGVIGYAAIIWMVDMAGVEDGAIASDSDISALQEFIAEFGTINAYKAALDGALAAVGGPYVASTVSQMTDHSKVYVYTGSQTGYTAGHWYYWNGSAWTDGGVYQAAAVETDKTLTVADMAADAKATGDAVAELKNDLEYITGNDIIQLTDGQYVNTNGTPIDLTPVSNSQWSSCVISCTPGDIFTAIDSTGASNQRVWTFIDSANNVITQGANSNPVNDTIVAPAGAVKLIYNTKGTGVLVTNTLLRNDVTNDTRKITDLIGVEEIPFTYAQYYVTSTSSPLDAPVSNKQYKSAIVTCAPGDIFTISGIGGTSASVSTFGFYDSNDVLISRSESVSLDRAIVKAPLNAAKLVINIRTTVADTKCYKGAVYSGGEDLQSTVPFYYRTHLDTIISAINALDDDSGLSGDTFVFVTDYHVQSNERNSAPLIKKILEDTGTGFVVFGGDAQDFEHTYSDAVAANTEFKNDYKHVWDSMFNVIGNHEFNSHYATEQDDSMVLSYNQVYGFFQKQREYRYGGRNEYGDYFVDNIAQKIRYFFVGCTSGITVNADQRDWLFKQFEVVPAGYSVIVFSHLTFLYYGSDSSTTNIRVASNIQTISNAMTKVNARTTFTSGGVTYDYTSSQAECIAIIGGHTHYDASTDYSGLVDNNGTPYTPENPWPYGLIIATTTDAIYKQQSNTGALVRTPGTITEQAFDVVHIDLENRKIIMKRIGAGNDRVFDY